MMTKKIRRIVLPLALIVVFLASFSSAMAVTPRELVNSASEKMQSAKSFEMAQAMKVILLEKTGQKTDIEITSVSRFVAKPYQMSVHLKAYMLGYSVEPIKPIEMEIYIVPEGKGYVTYTKTGDEVTKQVMADVLETAPAGFSTGALLNSSATLTKDMTALLKSVQYEGVKALGTKKAHSITALVDVNKGFEQMVALQAAAAGESMSVSDKEYKEMMANLPQFTDMAARFYIDTQTGYFSRIHLYQTEFAQNLVNQMELGDVRVPNFESTFDFSHWNQIQKITVPAAIKKAAVLQKSLPAIAVEDESEE